MAREPIETCDGPYRVLTRGSEKPRRPCRSLRGVRLHPPTELAAGDEYDVGRAGTPGHGGSELGDGYDCDPWMWGSRQDGV